MKKALYIVVLLCPFLPVFSQNCGHLGKRFMIHADVTLSPAYLNPNFMGKSGWVHFNYIFSPNIEIIAWNKGTVGISGHYFTSQFESVQHNADYFFYETLRKNVPFWGFGYGFFYKQYFPGSRASMGSFAKIEVDFLHTRFQGNTFLEPIKSFTGGVKFEIGKDYLFFNRLKISTGASLGLTFKGYKDTGYDNPQVENRLIMEHRVLGIYWLGIRVGIGILAF